MKIHTDTVNNLFVRQCVCMCLFVCTISRYVYTIPYVTRGTVIHDALIEKKHAKRKIRKISFPRWKLEKQQRTASGRISRFSSVIQMIQSCFTSSFARTFLAAHSFVPRETLEWVRAHRTITTSKSSSLTLMLLQVTSASFFFLFFFCVFFFFYFVSLVKSSAYREVLDEECCPKGARRNR